MKLIKHCHEVDLSAPGGIAQGALLGLVTDTRLEITHAFPFPSSSTGAAAGADDSVDDEDFQLDVMRKLRMVNVGTTCSLLMINSAMTDRDISLWQITCTSAGTNLRISAPFCHPSSLSLTSRTRLPSRSLSVSYLVS